MVRADLARAFRSPIGPSTVVVSHNLLELISDRAGWPHAAEPGEGKRSSYTARFLPGPLTCVPQLRDVLGTGIM